MKKKEQEELLVHARFLLQCVRSSYHTQEKVELLRIVSDVLGAMADKIERGE